MATEAMNESWARVTAQIESIWEEAEFEDSELRKARGSLKKMVDLIHEKTGEDKTEIVQKITAVL